MLGADDKAGIAEIMTAAATLIANPEIRHGTIRILFTTDEEIGRGADKVDIAKLGAAFAYTLDGGRIGEIDDETFSADGVDIEISGVAQHPGTSKGVMENAIKIASGHRRTAARGIWRPKQPTAAWASSIRPTYPINGRGTCEVHHS